MKLGFEFGSSALGRRMLDKEDMLDKDDMSYTRNMLDNRDMLDKKNTCHNSFVCFS